MQRKLIFDSRSTVIVEFMLTRDSIDDYFKTHDEVWIPELPSDWRDRTHRHVRIRLFESLEKAAEYFAGEYVRLHHVVQLKGVYAADPDKPVYISDKVLVTGDRRKGELPSSEWGNLNHRNPAYWADWDELNHTEERGHVEDWKKEYIPRPEV